MDGLHEGIGSKGQVTYLWKAESELYKIGMGVGYGFRCEIIQNLYLELKILLVASFLASAQTKCQIYGCVPSSNIEYIDKFTIYR
jgi:hypothetical protein